MKNKLLLFLFVISLAPIFANADVTKTLEIDFAFNRPAYEEQQLLGYRLYKEGTKVCETNDPAASKITCDILTGTGTFNFTLTAYYANGVTSPHSPSFPFTISTTPTTPPDATGTKKISYSIDSNTPTGDRAGYRMYMNDTLLCVTANVYATSLDCTADLINAPMAFSVTTIDSKGIESQKSNILLLDPSTVPVDISPTPDALMAVIKPTPASGQVPLQVSFAGTDSTGDISSYSWEFGDGSKATGSLVSHNYSVAGTYTATLLVANKNGDTRKISTTITALPSNTYPQPPKAIISSSTAAGNAPLLVSFDGSASTTVNLPIAKYSWTFGDGSSATGKTVSHSFTTAGTYYTELTIVDSKGLTNKVSTPIIIVGSVSTNKKPNAVISASPLQGTAPLTVSFDGSKSSDPDGTIVQYNWNFGDGATATGPTNQHTYKNPGTYTASLQVTDNQGETASATKVIVSSTTQAENNLHIEVGEVSIDHEWVKVFFKNTYSQPIVIAGPPTRNGGDPVLVRIRNIDQKGFEIHLQEWDYLDGSHTREYFNYIVIEKGIYTLSNGVKIEAGSFTGSNAFQKISLQQKYNFAPIILTQVITENETDAVTGRVQESSQSSFDYKLQEQETTKEGHIPETVGYIAWEPGTGEISGLSYESGTTGNSVDNNWFTLTFQTEFPDLPFFIAGIQTYQGSDTVAVRMQNISPSSTQVTIEEEQSVDTEVNHVSEVVGYLAISTTNAAEKLSRLTTFNWEFNSSQENSIIGFNIYNNNKQICVTSNPSDRTITCETEISQLGNSFSIKAINISGSETDVSNILEYKP